MEYKKFLNKVAKLTAENFHTEARIEIAKYFGLNKQIDNLKSIKRKHSKLGYMTIEMSRERQNIEKEMMKLVPKDLRGEVYSML